MMEMKEIAREVLALFGVDHPGRLTEAIRKVLFSPDSASYFDRYIRLCPDLSVDWMQRIYQFYCADRKEKKQDYTPTSLARMLSFLTCPTAEEVVYDCCAGSGSLTIQRWVINPKASFICEELDGNVIPILLLNLCIRNIRATVIQRDILKGETRAVYHVEPGEKYSTLRQDMFAEGILPEADCSVSNPPFNLLVPVCEEILSDLPAKSTCNFAFVANCLKRARRFAAVILPTGVLASKEERECRRYYAERGWLKAAIALPGKMFESTSVSTCILLFDKDKTSQDVMLVNAEEMASKVIREQRGEGEASHYNRIYRKELNSYTDEQIAAVCELTWKEVEGYSKRVSLGELAEKNYSLSLGPYLPIYMEGTLHRDFNAIIADINRVIRERNVVKLTVNKVWAKKLGLEEVIEECNANNEIVKAINESLQLISNYTFKEKIIENKYIQSSHSKVLTIENTDKDILSSIMPFFMNMYKQHIFYLNLEENRLLAELRDSMLPFLMNGQLEVKGGSV